MKIIKIAINMILDQWFRNAVLIVLVAVLVSIMSMFFSDNQKFNKIIDVGNYFEINKTIVYSTSYFSNLSYQEKLSLIDKIEDVTGVKDCFSMRSNEALIPSTGLAFSLTSLSDEFFRNKNYPLSDGVWPSYESTNEVILANTFRSYYQVGDEIIAYVLVANDSTGHADEKHVKLKIMGFLDDQDFVFSTQVVSNYPNLEHYFVPVSRLSEYAIVFNLEDDSGEKIERANLSSTYIIQVDNEANVDDVKQRLSEVLPNTECLHTGESLINGYKDFHYDELKSLVFKAIIVFALAITTLLASTFLNILTKRRELTVYYMFGASWQLCIQILCLTQAIVLAIGISLGLFCFSYLAKGIYPFSIENTAYIVIVFVIIFAFTIIPYYLMTRKDSPIELMRKD